MSAPYYADDAVTLHHGGCLDVLREMPDASVDAVVTDPPYAINFMGRKWDSFKGSALGACEECGDDDPAEGMRVCLECISRLDEEDLRGAAMLGQQSQNWNAKATHSRGYADNNNAAFQRWCALWSTECLRVLKPGGHMLAFGGSRTWHRLACAVEDAGFEIRDSIAWLYGSGFPKSLDVSKAIDKAAGAERTVLATIPDRWAGKGSVLQRSTQAEAESVNLAAPATSDAARWQGWGTALKPAFEPIVVGRKPLVGTVAANVLAHGTGALNVVECRTGGAERHNPSARTNGPDALVLHTGVETTGRETTGRWPTNVILDDSQAAELDRQTGVSASRVGKPRGASSGDGWGMTATGAEYDDQGGASRFFPTFHYEAKAPALERPRNGETAHPTVKPVDLMRWLVRLVTPPGGLVLDPFAGSGTTAEACVVEGFRCVLIEREADYLPLIVQRLTKPIAPVLDFGASA